MDHVLEENINNDGESSSDMSNIPSQDGKIGSSDLSTPKFLKSIGNNRSPIKSATHASR